MKVTYNSTTTRPASRRRLPWYGLITGLLLMAANSSAEPARNRILDQVHVTEQAHCAVIEVGFTLPIRYVRHFPYDEGNELRIKLDPISVSALDRPALAMRESLRPARGGDLPLYEVVYEGDMEGGPFLTLEFRRAVAFTVRQGPAFRSVVITVSLSRKSPGRTCPLEKARAR